jgi:hypothetical protein
LTKHSVHYPLGVKRIAQVGLVSKGLVYTLFGVLILMATYGTGNSPVKLFSIIKYIITFGWYGRLTVMVLVLGLLCYAVWKLLQMVLNTEGYNKSLYGYFIRVTWVGPFSFYLVLSGHAIWQLYKFYSGTFSYGADEAGLAKYLFMPHGNLLIGLVSVILAVNAGSLFYLALTGKYTTMLTGKRFYNDAPRFAKISGFSGYFFYGLALFIIAVLFALSIYYTDSSMAQGGESMLTYFIDSWYGRLLLAAIAFGTCSYGVYFIMASGYRWRDE